MPKIEVGSLAIATRASGVCAVDEPGVCYEVYELEGRPGYSFIFQNGGHDGFNPQDVENFLHVTGGFSYPVADYRFENVGRLAADYKAGVFAPAFFTASNFTAPAAGANDDLPDPTEAQADAMGFEAARRQYMKEQFISGRDDLPEPQGSLGRDAERRWHLRDMLPPDMLPLPEDLTELLATYPELDDMLRECEADDAREAEAEHGPDIEPEP
jgi:hypothetical protein